MENKEEARQNKHAREKTAKSKAKPAAGGAQAGI